MEYVVGVLVVCMQLHNNAEPSYQNYSLIMEEKNGMAEKFNSDSMHKPPKLSFLAG